MSVKIKSIEIVIGDKMLKKTIKLTVEQAKELKEMLSEMFAVPDLIIERQYPWFCPVPCTAPYPWQHWDYSYISDGTASFNLNI